VVTSKVRLMLLGVMAVFVVSVAVSSSALALPTAGPFWQVNGTKLAVGISKNITNKGGETTLYSTINRVRLKITCKEVTSIGAISNSASHGESQETIEFKKECKLFILNSKQEYVLQTGCHIVEPLRFIQASDDLWYHTRVNNQRSGATERTSSEQVRFTPKGTQIFITLEITEEPECVFPGKFTVEGSVAGEIKPEQTEVVKGEIVFPSEQQKHLWRPTSSQIEETQPLLIFAKEEARLEGRATVELESKERFGTIE
jgi:hypothetical protein